MNEHQVPVMKTMLSTKEVAKFLDVNEKMIYTLVAEKGLPATKVTGKWLFPQHLVEQWIEISTINYPKPMTQLPPYHGLLIITGSNDPLLDRTMTLFNKLYPEHVSVFGNLGSMGGLRALRQNLCHMASSHLLVEDGNDYNFEFAIAELDVMPAVVNFCRREQGILVQKGNPKNISGIVDLAQPGIRIVNRPLGTGTRLLLDGELKKMEIEGSGVEGYHHEVQKHIDVAVDVMSGRADAGLGIRAVADILDLGFIPLRWERYDFLINKERYFDEGVQLFIGLLHDDEFKTMANQYAGYDLSLSGRVIFPGKGK